MTEEIESNAIGIDWQESWVDMASLQLLGSSMQIDVYFVGSPPDDVKLGWFGWYTYELPVQIDRLTFKEIDGYQSTVPPDESTLWDVSAVATGAAIELVGTQGQISIRTGRNTVTRERKKTDDTRKVTGFALGEYCR